MAGKSWDQTALLSICVVDTATRRLGIYSMDAAQLAPDRSQVSESKSNRSVRFGRDKPALARTHFLGRSQLEWLTFVTNFFAQPGKAGVHLGRMCKRESQFVKRGKLNDP